MGLPPDILSFAAQLGLALALGGAIGVERQWRRRLAGIQTNALVALGAAGFVGFSELVTGESSPTRVAAQVVSGIGFLGAGVIFKDGFTVRGLNTAATIWCSAAVGVLCGKGMAAHAVTLAAMVAAVNLLLRPLAMLVLAAATRDAAQAKAEPVDYEVTIVCGEGEEARMRAVLLQAIRKAGLMLQRLDSRNRGPGETAVEIRATLGADRDADEALEEAIGQLSLDPSVGMACWRRADPGG